jgi:hypothetical protein
LVRKPLAKFSHPESISGRCGGKNCCDFKPKSNLTHNKLVVRPHEKIAFVFYADPDSFLFFDGKYALNG